MEFVRVEDVFFVVGWRLKRFSFSISIFFFTVKGVSVFFSKYL